MKSAFTAIVIIYTVIVVVIAIFIALAYWLGIFDRPSRKVDEKTEILDMYEDYKDEPYLPEPSIEVFSTKKLFCEIIRRIRNQ